MHCTMSAPRWRLCYALGKSAGCGQVAEQSSANEQEHRVLKFRPPGSTFERPLPDSSPVEDLRKYEGDDEPDDYRHRMIVNIAALAATIFLVVAGVWIANTMAQLRKNQDCVLAGRRACAPIEVPVQTR
jgi:hypothetical protein